MTQEQQPQPKPQPQLQQLAEIIDTVLTEFGPDIDLVAAMRIIRQRQNQAIPPNTIDEISKHMSGIWKIHDRSLNPES